MKRKDAKTTLLTGSLIAGALVAFSVSADARPTTEVLGNGAEVRAEIIELNVNSSADKLYELKCGTETGSTEKKSEAKPKAKEGKATEAKCGEGKCGSKDKKATDKKAAKSEKKEKTSEGKCGEGKCGAQ